METNDECNFDILSQPGIKYRRHKLQRGGTTVVVDIRIECDFEHLDLKNKPLNNRGKVASSITVGSVKNPTGLGVIEYSDIFLKYFPHYKDRLIVVNTQGIFEQDRNAKDTKAHQRLLFAFYNDVGNLGSRKLMSHTPEQESSSKIEHDFISANHNEDTSTCTPETALKEQASVGHLEPAQGQDDTLRSSSDINLLKTNSSVQIKNQTSQGITQEVEYEQEMGDSETAPSFSQQASDVYDDINVLSGNCPSTRPHLSHETNKDNAYYLSNGSNGSSLDEVSPQNNIKHSHSSNKTDSADSKSTASESKHTTNDAATNTRPVLRVSDSPMNARRSKYDKNIVKTKAASKRHNDKQSNTEQKVVCSDKDRYYMSVALELAQESALKGEVPVGAIIVDAQGNIVGGGNNQTITNNDPSAHAEIIALRNAGKKLCNYRMNECTMYVTLEPCCMCAMALVHARLKEVVFGAYDPKTGACGSMLHLIDDYKHNHKVLVRGGVMEEQCASVLSQFFARRREEKKAEQQAKSNQANQD